MEKEDFSNPELDAVVAAINGSSYGDYGESLLAEVFWSAMHFLKRNPSASIEETCAYGLGEWIK